jgi:inorganic phosphate transporter, PiT family
LLFAIIAIIAVALVFDFINGFHDAANSIATVVATKVLPPLWAVVWAAFFNFIAALVFPTHVAATIGKDVIQHSYVDIWVILAALIGAIAWDLITWIAGLPTSSSHALIGGLVGAAVAKMHLLHATSNPLIWSGLLKIILFIFLSPLIGLVLGLLVMSAVAWTCRKKPPGKVDRWFRRLQLLSAAGYSLGHGLNDAQKTMGIIWMLLIAVKYSPHLGPGSPAFMHWLMVGKQGASLATELPPWVILMCGAAIALGTMSGGWRIVHTMGMKITKLKPPGGFSAETAGAITLIGVSLFGIPVSTTHTITGAIVGVGATRRLSAVRWGVAGRIVWAWVLTIPAAAIVGALTYCLINVIVH